MQGEGTVKDHTPFNPQHDAEVLRKAMKGFGVYFQFFLPSSITEMAS